MYEKLLERSDTASFLSVVSDIFCLVLDIFLDNINDHEIVSMVLAMKNSNISVIYYSPEVRRGKYWEWGVFLLQ